MLNSSVLNSKPLNSSGVAASIDWTLFLPVERQSIYVLDIGGMRLPVSSAQATMRLSGQSFLQAVVPNGAEYIEGLEGLIGTTMKLLSGYRYADGEVSPLEPIAETPFQLMPRAQGPERDTLTLSGYGTRTPAPPMTRALSKVQIRQTETSGRRRVRCEVDVLLRPGHTAVDSDGIEFSVGIIQYFIGATSEAMEVIQDG